jgi:hypothetical protein
MQKIILCCLLLGCSSTLDAQVLSLQASTPADSIIRTMLQLDQGIVIDFIRWDLHLLDEKNFELQLHYGESQPNTLGFKLDGRKKSIKGEYRIEINHAKGAVYQFHTDDSGIKFSFLQLNEDLFHLLDSEQKLLLGNGGWIYSLNRSVPQGKKSELPVLLSSPVWIQATPDVAVYDGRTPCAALAEDYKIPVSNECFKLKWRLTLHRDSISKQPTRYTLQRIFRRADAIQGSWELSKSDASAAAIIRLRPDDPKDEALQFLIGDENVLFFLDTQQHLMVGNGDFSFALNRKLR